MQHDRPTARVEVPLSALVTHVGAPYQHVEDFDAIPIPRPLSPDQVAANAVARAFGASEPYPELQDVDVVLPPLVLDGLADLILHRYGPELGTDVLTTVGIDEKGEKVHWTKLDERPPWDSEQRRGRAADFALLIRFLWTERHDPTRNRRAEVRPMELPGGHRVLEEALDLARLIDEVEETIEAEAGDGS